jgi:hypothetical protein
MNVLIRKALLVATVIAIGSGAGLGCSTENKPDAGKPIEAVPTAQEGGRTVTVPKPPPVTAPDWSHATCAQFNDGGACTPTEQLFLNKSPACYGCLANAGCLNTAKFDDTGHECSDALGVAARGAKVGAKRSDLCLSTLECILSKGCASEDVALCYCGSLGAGNGCTTAMSGAKGVCLQKEVDGLEHMAAEPPKVVVPDYFNRLLGAGMANEIFSCSRYNGCGEVCGR